MSDHAERLDHPEDPPSTAQERITKMIRAYMGANGERQLDLARLLDVEQPQVSRMLSGRRKLTVDELELIARHYGEHPGQFFEGFYPGQSTRNWKKNTAGDLELLPGDGEDPTPGPGQMTLPFPPLRLVK